MLIIEESGLQFNAQTNLILVRTISILTKNAVGVLSSSNLNQYLCQQNEVMLLKSCVTTIIDSQHGNNSYWTLTALLSNNIGNTAVLQIYPKIWFQSDEIDFLLLKVSVWLFTCFFYVVSSDEKWCWTDLLTYTYSSLRKCWDTCILSHWIL